MKKIISNGGFMKKILVLFVVIFVLVVVCGAEIKAETSVTSVVVEKVINPGVEQIIAKVVIKKVNGAPVPQVDQELFKYLVSVSFVYNRDKTSALMVMEVKTSDVDKVKALLAQKQAIVDTSDADQIEKEYKGFKKRIHRTTGK